MNERGIKAVISNIVGLPYETPELFAKTIEVNKRIHRKQVVFSPANGAAPKIWVFNPFPGTPLHDECKARGWLKSMPGKFDVYRESYIDMPAFGRKEIDRAYRTFRYKVYKEQHPLHALFFLAYDSRVGNRLTGLVPDFLFGWTRRFFTNFAVVREAGAEAKGGGGSSAGHFGKAFRYAAGVLKSRLIEGILSR